MDEAKLHEFLGKLVGDMSGAFMMGMVLIGDELGLYRAMGDNQPVTADALASRCKCNARLVREWLNANAAAGYVEHSDGRYRLPAEQAMALANEDSPVYVAPGQNVLAACFLGLDQILSAFRGDGGLPWGQHHHRLFHGVEKFFRPGYRANLTTAWLPALDGVVAKLERGAKVADVGCGHGASTIVMAEAYPKSRFFGFDLHARSIETASRRAVEAGVAERATFATAPAKGYTERGFDLVCFFDCLHDMGDPIGAARHVRDTLADDGTWMIVEPAAGDRVEDNFNPIGRTYYGFSTLLCTPCSLAQDVGMALGTQAGPARIRDVATSAGFTRFRIAAQTPFNTLYEIRP